MPRTIRRRHTLRVFCEALECRALLAGTWTPLAHTAPTGTSTMMLLSDGSVMVQRGSLGEEVSSVWYKLTPDSAGSYVNGTWSNLASMHLQRLYYASNVLKDGRVFVLGGEYSGPNGNANFTNTGEIYDPVANTWMNIPNFPRTQFGDDPSEMLPDGRVLCGYISGPQTFIYDPVANTWSTGPTKLNNDRSDEETWVMLPDQSVLSYNIFGNPQHAQRYNPATNTWVDSGAVPVQLQTGGGFEIGPALLLPDHRVFHIGGTPHNALYTPPANGIGPGTWAAAPDTPGNIGANDAPGAMLPNGHVLYAAGDTSTSFNPPTTIFDYDPIASTITQVTGGPNLSTQPPYVTRMLMLPTGQVLFTDSTNQLWVYTATGAPDPSWRPTITNITNNGSNVFTLTGTQINGISEGASYGDDAEMSTNYPIVRLTDSAGVVRFARTFNWSSTGVATGSAPLSVQFTLPAGALPGVYRVAVIGSGIASPEVLNVQIGAATTASVTLRADPNNPSNLQVLGGASALASVPLNSIGGVFVSGDSAANSITVNDDFAGVPVFASGGGGNDALQIVGTGAAGAVWTITSTNVSRAGFGGVTYRSDIESLRLTAGTGLDTITVNDTSPATSVTLGPSAGDDIVNVNTDNTGAATGRFDATQRLGQLNIGDGGLVTIAAGGEKVLVLASLAIGAAGRFDVTDNAFVIDYTAPTPVASINALLASGYANGAWTGPGIISSTAAANPSAAIGYGESTSLFTKFPADFHGQMIDDTAIVAQYTINGDANLDSTVNLLDFNLLAQNFGLSNRTFAQGDFDYNNLVDLLDFNILSLHFGQSLFPQFSTALRLSPLATKHLIDTLRDDVLA